MLTRVQQHPSLPRQRTGKNASKHRPALCAAVVLLSPGILDRPDTVEHKVTMRRFSGRLAAKVGALGAGLNPKVRFVVGRKLPRGHAARLCS